MVLPHALRRASCMWQNQKTLTAGTPAKTENSRASVNGSFAPCLRLSANPFLKHLEVRGLDTRGKEKLFHRCTNVFSFGRSRGRRSTRAVRSHGPASLTLALRLPPQVALSILLPALLRFSATFRVSWEQVLVWTSRAIVEYGSCGAFISVAYDYVTDLCGG